MGRCVVLKDLFNKPAGYALVSGEQIICRIPLKERAQMAIVFSDGSREIYPLDQTEQEQRFACNGKAIYGCCVFEKTQLLYLSDEGMRMAFAQLLQPEHSCESRSCTAKSEPETEKSPQEENWPEQEKRCSNREFAQRRWPQPPCWSAAQYVHGCWQEEQKRRE